MPIGNNRVLGDSHTPPAARPHRVAIAAWPTMDPKGVDPRTRSLEALVNHCAASGYEGVEFHMPTLERFFPGDSPPVVA